MLVRKIVSQSIVPCVVFVFIGFWVAPVVVARVPFGCDDTVVVWTGDEEVDDAAGCAALVTWPAEAVVVVTGALAVVGAAAAVVVRAAVVVGGAAVVVVGAAVVVVGAAVVVVGAAVVVVGGALVVVGAAVVTYTEDFQQKHFVATK